MTVISVAGFLWHKCNMMNEKEVVEYVMELFCGLKWTLAFKVKLDVNKKGVIVATGLANRR